MGTDSLTHNVLQDEYVSLVVEDLSITDSLQEGCEVVVALQDFGPLIGEGIGFIDALFDAFKSHFASQYDSLHTITLHDFKIHSTGKKGKYHLSKVPGTEALCDVVLTLNNSRGKPFDFHASSPSVTAAAALVVARGVEHYVNAERAYKTLQHALSDAKGRGRHDLSERYTKQLAELVKCTSYASLIDSPEIITK